MTHTSLQEARSKRSFPHKYSSTTMFSPRKSHKKPETHGQSILLLADTSYDVDKSAELRKHVTEVSSDDDTFNLPLYTMIHTQQGSPMSPASSHSKQRFFRLDKKKNRRRKKSRPAAGINSQSTAEHALQTEAESEEQSSLPANACESMLQDDGVGKKTSFDTTLPIDDSTSNESTVQNSISMQTSSGSGQDLECSGSLLSSASPSDPQFQGVDNVVSVRIVDGLAHMLVAAPVLDDLSSDDEASTSQQKASSAAEKSQLQERNDLGSLFNSKVDYTLTPKDNATSASFDFSAVNWRAPGGTAATSASIAREPIFREHRPISTKGRVLQRGKADFAHGDDPFDRHIASIGDKGTEDSFTLHSYSSDFDFPDISFANELDDDWKSSKSSDARAPFAGPALEDRTVCSAFDATDPFDLQKSVSHDSLSCDLTDVLHTERSDDFNLSFSFVSIDWEQSSSVVTSHNQEPIRIAPQRTGSHLSQESQQRIKDYLLKERKDRPSKSSRSVGYRSTRTSKIPSYNTQRVPTKRQTHASRRFSNPSVIRASTASIHGSNRRVRKQSIVSSNDVEHLQSAPPTVQNLKDAPIRATQEASEVITADMAPPSGPPRSRRGRKVAKASPRDVKRSANENESSKARSQAQSLDSFDSKQVPGVSSTTATSSESREISLGADNDGTEQPSSVKERAPSPRHGRRGTLRLSSSSGASRTRARCTLRSHSQPPTVASVNNT
ncbi:hypothetical protein MPSEU_000412900 [Mayamaea pseudoterrestris]|nr:hypothetical protein MPSEU_000412900 [Mayamaea pseudoterrestris]